MFYMTTDKLEEPMYAEGCNQFSQWRNSGGKWGTGRIYSLSLFLASYPLS